MAGEKISWTCDLSRPARARGLKLRSETLDSARILVAPRAGAWIETGVPVYGDEGVYVAPRAGAWIETMFMPGQNVKKIVAPRAGAWIETREDWLCRASSSSRAPRGRVD